VWGVNDKKEQKNVFCPRTFVTQTEPLTCLRAHAFTLQHPATDRRVVTGIIHQLANVASPATAVGGLRELDVLPKPGRALDFDVGVNVTPRRDGDDGIAQRVGA